MLAQAKPLAGVSRTVPVPSQPASLYVDHAQGAHSPLVLDQQNPMLACVPTIKAY